MLDATPDRSRTRSRARVLVDHPVALDLLVAAGATAAAVWVMAVSTELGARSADALGVGLLVAGGAALLARRRWPAAVLVIVTVLMTIYLRSHYPGGAELPLIMTGLYTAAAEGRRLVGLLVFGFAVVTNVSYRLFVDGDDPLLVAFTVLLLVLVVTLGETTRARRQLRDEVRERLRLVAHEKEFEAQVARTTERLRIARELHDVLAHTITAIAVQAGATADGLDEHSPARPVLRAMRTSAQEAMRQLQASIAVLRSGHDDPRWLATPTLADLDALVDSVRAAGLEVDLDVAQPPGSIPAAVELTGYRIIQESLTNVIRHAAAARAHVTVGQRPGAVTITITDDGAASHDTSHDASHDAAGEATGFGLAGMRERVAAIGGSLTAGPRDAGGFEVHAVLPTGPTPPIGAHR